MVQHPQIQRVLRRLYQQRVFLTSVFQVRRPRLSAYIAPRRGHVSLLGAGIQAHSSLPVSLR